VKISSPKENREAETEASNGGAWALAEKERWTKSSLISQTAFVRNVKIMFGAKRELESNHYQGVPPRKNPQLRP